MHTLWARCLPAGWWKHFAEQHQEHGAGSALKRKDEDKHPPNNHGLRHCTGYARCKRHSLAREPVHGATQTCPHQTRRQIGARSSLPTTHGWIRMRHARVCAVTHDTTTRAKLPKNNSRLRRRLTSPTAGNTMTAVQALRMARSCSDDALPNPAFCST